MLVTGLTVRDCETRRKRVELRQEYETLRSRSGRRYAAKKSSDGVRQSVPVPETDTGREVENTEGREITLSKELGKMTP